MIKDIDLDLDKLNYRKFDGKTEFVSTSPILLPHS